MPDSSPPTASLPETPPPASPSAAPIPEAPSAPSPSQQANIVPPTQAQATPASATAKKTTFESAEAIKSRTTKLSIAFFLLAIFMVVILAATNIYTKNKLNAVQLNKQQVLSSEANSQFLQQASGYVQGRQEQLQYILSSLPDETTLVEFVKALEIISDDKSAASSIDFNALAPTGPEGEKYIPIKITLTTDQPNFFDFLKQIEKLPYILEVTQVEANRLVDSNDLWQYVLIARVYVQDDFYQVIKPKL